MAAIAGIIISPELAVASLVYPRFGQCRRWRAETMGEQYMRSDSLVDNVADPFISVVQNPTQAYPAYLITHH